MNSTWRKRGHPCVTGEQLASNNLFKNSSNFLDSSDILWEQHLFQLSDVNANRCSLQKESQGWIQGLIFGFQQLVFRCYALVSWDHSLNVTTGFMCIRQKGTLFNYCFIYQCQAFLPEWVKIASHLFYMTHSNSVQKTADNKYGCDDCDGDTHDTTKWQSRYLRFSEEKKRYWSASPFVPFAF